jgi:hypothetical protein
MVWLGSETDVQQAGMAVFVSKNKFSSSLLKFQGSVSRSAQFYGIDQLSFGYFSGMLLSFKKLG